MVLPQLWKTFKDQWSIVLFQVIYKKVVNPPDQSLHVLSFTEESGTLNPYYVRTSLPQMTSNSGIMVNRSDKPSEFDTYTDLCILVYFIQLQQHYTGSRTDVRLPHTTSHNSLQQLTFLAKYVVAQSKDTTFFFVKVHEVFCLCFQGFMSGLLIWILTMWYFCY